MVFDISDDPDDLQVFPVRVHPQALAHRVPIWSKTPGQCFVDDDYSGT